ncbi:MAG: GAF domain-containing protein [Anaerolineae bacterium]|nr:GAF domain-containing protein [Anaerolineae bacterium]
MTTNRGGYMWNRVKRFFTPPVFEGDAQKTERAVVLTIVVWVVMVAATVGGIILGIVESWSGLIPVLFIVAGVLFALLLVLIHFRRILLVSVLAPLLLLAAFTFPAWLFDGIRDTAMMGYFLVIIITAVVSTTHVMVFFTAASVVITNVLFVAESNGLITTSYGAAAPLSDLIILTIAYIASGLLLRTAVSRIAASYERARQDAEALEESNLALERNRDVLEAQTQTLERRARYLQASAVVARDAATAVSDLPRLLDNVVQVIGEQFGFYHAGLFLIEGDGEWAELRAASSVGGRQLVDQGYRLQVGVQGLVADVAEQGKPRVVRDVSQDASFINDPHFPDTRSEIVLPLRLGSAIIGVLDVQSGMVDAFTDEDVATLQALADQIALAINNAHLFQQVEASIEAERRAYVELSRAAWQDLLRAQPDLGYLSDGQGVRTADLLEPQMVAALEAGTNIIGEDQPVLLSIPIRVRDEVIGVVDGRKPDGTAWSAQEIELLEAMTEQLNVALESARLYRDTQRRAAREQLFSQVSGRIRQELDLEAVLKTSVDQIQQVLGLEQATIRLVREVDQDKV